MASATRNYTKFTFQGRNQIRLYQPEEGIYLAPRAPGNTWNLWHTADIDALFDSWDPDGSGSLEMSELNKQLRREVELDARLQAGAMGKIETSAANKRSPCFLMG